MVCCKSVRAQDGMRGGWQDVKSMSLDAAVLTITDKPECPDDDPSHKPPSSRRRERDERVCEESRVAVRVRSARNQRGKGGLQANAESGTEGKGFLSSWV